MSMIGRLLVITTKELNSLQKEPDSVREFLHGKIHANSDKTKRALLRVQEMAKQAMAAGTSKNNEALREQIIAELESAGAGTDLNGSKDLSLEKSWHCLHYLPSREGKQRRSKGLCREWPTRSGICFCRVPRPVQEFWRHDLYRQSEWYRLPEGP
jgi:hypothetical protein